MLNKPQSYDFSLQKKEMLSEFGYQIYRSVCDSSELASLRLEADSVARDAGTVCVRHLRKRSEIFRSLACSDLIRKLLPSGLRPVRSILFDKTPDENWPVPWHQDITIAVRERCAVEGYGPWSSKDGSPHVQPPFELLQGMVTVRLHLDDTPIENGALSVIPRSHKIGKLSSEEVRRMPKSDYMNCECSAGDVLLMSPLILHSSKRSMVVSRRRVVHFEFARESDLDSDLDWFEKI